MIICKNETFNFPFLLYRVIQNSATRYTKTLLIKFLVFIPKLYSALKICLWKSLQSESVKRGHSLYRGSNPEGGGGIMPPPSLFLPPSPVNNYRFKHQFVQSGSQKPGRGRVRGGIPPPKFFFRKASSQTNYDILDFLFKLKFLKF